MDNKKRILWITRTAVFLALLVVSQAATAPLGNPLVTGSIVNLLLVLTVMTCGVASGASVALISPVVAKLIGIGPLWTLIPFIMVGNVTLVLIWFLIGNRKLAGNQYVTYLVAAVIAAVGKCGVLYLGVVRIAVPVLLGLPEPQATVISNMFSIPQLITALVGGGLAVILIPRLKKAIGGREGIMGKNN